MWTVFAKCLRKIYFTTFVSTRFKLIGQPFANTVYSEPSELMYKPFSLMPPGVFIGNASVEADYIRVDVVTTSGETKSDVHMHVFPKKEVLERQPKPGGIPLNVALIMFDSTSAANFRRKMPNSLEYLTKDLGSVLMQGELICIFFFCTARFSLFSVWGELT